MTAKLRQYRYLLILIALLSVVFVTLIILGLDLGFVGDSLGFEAKFTALGYRGGMQYTLLWDRRHLLSGQFYAFLHFFFPGQSAAWYGSSLLTQFLIAPAVFLLSNAILRGERRWLSFTAALIAVFHTRQIVSHFEIPTGGHIKIGIILTLLSLYCYLRFVRGARREFFWRDLSIACYLVGILLYEATVLFFLLNPLIAYFEEHDQPGFRLNWRWLVQLIKDSLWYPLLFLFSFYLLSVLLPPDSGGVRSTNLSPSRLIEQFGRGLAGEFAPQRLIEQIVPALQSNWLILTLLVALGVGAIIVSLRRTDREGFAKPDQRVALLVLGIAMIAVNIVGIAPTEHALDDLYHSPRLASPSAIGIGFAFAAGLSLLLQRVPARRILFAGIAGLLIAVGVTRTFQVQQDYEAQHQAIEAITTAVEAAVPTVQSDPAPYFLIIADATYNDAIHARDIRFPLLFDLLYGISGSAADGVYEDVPADQAPLPDQAGSGLSRTRHRDRAGRDLFAARSRRAN